MATMDKQASATSNSGNRNSDSNTHDTAPDQGHRNCKHSHSRSHDHSHGHSHGHGHNAPPPLMMDNPSLQELTQAPVNEVVQSLSTLCRFGRVEAVKPLLQELEKQRGNDFVREVLQQQDDGGRSLLHWASKRVDDLRFLQLLVDLLAKLDLIDLINQASSDQVGMMPIHWASTEGSIPHVALLLRNGANIESKDVSGCTPLLIAAQYGQVEVVAYLIKKGANINAVDSSRDTAMHWAAYKGSIQVCGLLSFNEQLDFVTPDAYGQTPLHLASLRGNTAVVRYILSSLPKSKKDVLFLKDENQRTPLDVAIHKNRPTVQIVLREAMAVLENPRGHFFRQTIVATARDCLSPKSWKLWLGMAGGGDDMDEPVRFPFYFVISQFVVHVIIMLGLFAPVMNPGAGLMWDKTGWLMWNIFCMVTTWFFFFKTWVTSPGYVDQSNSKIGKWRKLYEDTLEAYAEEPSMDTLPSLCHTCHIARPLRSKHCRIARKCVLLFDHYCPFVDNTIGLANYKWFFGFLICMNLAIFSFSITLWIYLHRYTRSNPFPWVTFFFGLVICAIIVPVAAMLIYHTQLTMVNLTTNEHLNVRKYKYLYPTVNGKRQYKNPWFKGWWGNALDRFSPDERNYILPEDRVGFLSTEARGLEMV